MTGQYGTLVSEAELQDLFANRRPDAQAFREGVERKVKARRGEIEAEETESEATPKPKKLRRVAGWVPFESTLVSLLGAGKAGAGKLLPTILSLPFLVFGGVIAFFTWAIRALRRQPKTSLPSAWKQYEFRPWLGLEVERPAATNWWDTACVVGFVFAVTYLPWLATTRAVDAVVFGFALFMVVFVRGTKTLARTGSVGRGETAGLCFFLLLFPMSRSIGSTCTSLQARCPGLPTHCASER